MEKIKRKLSIVSICILIFVFLFPSFQQVFADGEEREVVTKVLHINNINNNKALEQIETLVGLNCNYGETAYIGEYFSVYNAEDDNLFFVYPIYVNSECKYLAEVSMEGIASLTTNVDMIEKIKNLPSNQYILYIDNGRLYAESSLNNIFIKQMKFINEDKVSEFAEYSFEEKEEYLKVIYGIDEIDYIDVFSEQLTYIVCNDKNYSRSVDIGRDGTLTTYQCSITNFVPQGGYNLCWAASSATIIKYKTGISFSATSLADKYNMSYTIGASIAQVKRILADFGLSYTSLLSRMQWTQIKENINADKPFIIFLKGGDGEETIKHTLTGYGYGCIIRDTTANVRAVYAWDPNGEKISFLYNTASTIITSGFLCSWESTLY
ncbi:hypothetical protein AALB81_11330 [Lachnospiraceae bacterium 48-33]